MRASRDADFETRDVATINSRIAGRRERPWSVSEYLKYTHSNGKMLCFRQDRTTQYEWQNEFSDTLLDNMKAALSLHFAWRNFCQSHFSATATRVTDEVRALD
jgi:hypothetical protein